MSQGIFCKGVLKDSEDRYDFHRESCREGLLGRENSEHESIGFRNHRVGLKKLTLRCSGTGRDVVGKNIWKGRLGPRHCCV